MAEDLKKDLTSDQVDIIDAHTKARNLESCILSWAEDAEQFEVPQKWGQWADVSTHSAGKRMCCSGEGGSVPCRSLISTGFVSEAGGEASSAFLISGGSAAKVGMVDGAESHARSHGSAAPITGGVATKVGIGESVGLSTGTLLTEQFSFGHDIAVRPHVSKQYTCEGTCQTDDGSPRIFERKVLFIKGFPYKNGGPCVPGRMWQGKSNRLCIDCYIAKYMVNASLEDVENLRMHWNKICKKSHREADKYNRKKRRAVGGDPPPTIRKLSEQQQARCSQWTLAARGIYPANPDGSKLDYRYLIRQRVQTVDALIRDALMPFGPEGEEMIKPAQKAFITHLTKLAETGACDRPDGNILNNATLQILVDLTPDSKNNELFLCQTCGCVAPNHLWHQEKKNYIRCRYCNTEYSPWMKGSRFCIRF